MLRSQVSCALNNISGRYMGWNIACGEVEKLPDSQTRFEGFVGLIAKKVPGTSVYIPLNGMKKITL